MTEAEVNRQSQADTAQPSLEVFSLYLQTIEKVSDRRSALNTWMITVLNAVIAVDFAVPKLVQAPSHMPRHVEALVAPVSGVLTSLVWMALLNSYSQLNRAKFMVIQDLERALGLDLFQREQVYYRTLRRRGLSGLERRIPLAYLIVCIVLLADRLYFL
jgi:hypothetical protein